MKRCLKAVRRAQNQITVTMVYDYLISNEKIYDPYEKLLY